MSRLRLASRLARRELREHLGRTLLALLIIAIPLLAAQGFAVAVATTNAKNEVRSKVVLDGADSSTDFVPPSMKAKTKRTFRTFEIHDQLVTPASRPDGQGPVLDDVTAIGLVPDSPRVQLVAGRLPRTKREVALTSAALASAGTKVGGRVELAAAIVELRVVGTVVVRDHVNDPTMVVGMKTEGADWVDAMVKRQATRPLDTAWASYSTLLWFPPGHDQQFFSMINEYPRTHITRDVYATGALGVGGVIAFIAVICSVAFTIGSRKQLRALGVLAIAGAAPADLGLSVLFQGVICGVLGAITATVATVVSWLTIARAAPVERFISQGLVDPPHPFALGAVVGISLLGIVIGSLAALLPARTASRVPVLTALGGRRPLPPIRTRMPIGGIVAVAAGTALITANVTSGNSSGWIVVLGSLGVVFGGVALAPALLVAAGRVGHRLRGTARLAFRGLTRDRTRNAAVIAAAAVAIALPVVALTAYARSDAHNAAYAPDETWISINAPDAQVGHAIDSVTRIAGDGAIVLPLYGTNPGTEPNAGAPGRGYVAMTPSQARTMFPHTQIAEHLALGHAVAVDGDYQFGSQPLPSTQQTDPLKALFVGQPPPVDHIHFANSGDWTNAFPRDLTSNFASKWLVPAKLIAPTAISRRIGATVWRATPLTSAENDAINVATSNYSPTLAQIRSETAGMSSRSWLVYTNASSAMSYLPYVLVALPVAAVIAFVVVLTALALSAADGRDDERLFAALGAPPNLLRRRRSFEAGLLTLLAGILSLVIGLVPTLMVIWASPTKGGDGMPARVLPPGYNDLHVPVVDLIALIGGMALLVAAVVWIGLAVKDQFRRRTPLVLQRT